MSCPRIFVHTGLGAPILGAPIGLFVLIGAVALSACSGAPQTGQAQADAETRAACQARAEQVYNQQNRGEIYSAPATVNTPYSANYVPAMSDRGLADLFVHDRMVSDCIRNTGSGSDRTLPSSSAAPPGPPGPPAPRH
jgi:hypothetical protein